MKTMMEVREKPIPRELQQAVDGFIVYCRVECGFAPATLEAYRRDLDDLTRWMTRNDIPRWRDLTEDHLKNHLRDLTEQHGLAASSIVRHIATIRVFGRFLEAGGYCPVGPFNKLLRP